VARGRTTGAPIAMRIVNRDFANQPADPAPLTAPRPGHADLAGGTKYGLEDFRLVRERASARETAARVAAGAVARGLLAAFGTNLGSYVTSIGDVTATLPAPEDLAGSDLRRLADEAEDDAVRCPDPVASTAMQAAIDVARHDGETLGGVFVAFATGVPVGLGSHVHWDRKLDGRLAGAVCSIPAVKGVELGPAFDLAARPGSRAQDALTAAGGALDNADLDHVNLAAPVSDGEQLAVPHLGEATPVPTRSGRSASGSGGATPTPQGVWLLNINTATSGDFRAMPGIGKVTADKLVAYRQQNGQYATVDDLVKAGLHKTELAKIRARLSVQ